MKKLILSLLFIITGFLAFGQMPNQWSPTSGTDTYTTNVFNFGSSYANKIAFVKFGNTNTGAATININSIGAANLRMWDGDSWEPLTASQIDVNTVYKIAYNGSFFQMESFGTGGGSGDLEVGVSAITSGTNTRVLYNNSGTLGEYTVSGSGNVAMTTSPTFTTPNLGTPSAVNLTNATGLTREFGFACSDLTTALSASIGTTKGYIPMPRNFTLTGVFASVVTAQTAGSVITIDIKENGTTILSTYLTIDNNENTSFTAATPAVISDTSLAQGSIITAEIRQVGTSPTGLIVGLIGY
jgi:hypothetical protein